MAQFREFLGDGYREIRGLVSSNAPPSLKKVFSSGSLALILVLLAVTIIASQIHPVVAVLSVGCVLLIVYGRTLFQRLALFTGYFLCGFILFVGVGLIAVVPMEKEYPLLAKIIAVVLFGTLCLVIPALVSVNRKREIAVNAQSRLAQRTEVKKTALTFADVGGLEDPKEEIRELVQANLDGDRLGKYGVCRNGILLHGPQGTGKTFLAEAVAGEFGLNYFYVSAASLVDKYIGQTEENLEAVFRRARSNRPALLFIDEIDALGTKRQQLGESDDPGGCFAVVQFEDRSTHGLYRRCTEACRSNHRCSRKCL